MCALNGVWEDCFVCATHPECILGVNGHVHVQTRCSTQTKQNWSADGCKKLRVSTINGRNVTVCECNHLTSFSLKREAFTPGVNTIDFGDIEAVTWANLMAHPAPFATMVTLLLLYLAMLYPTYRADQQKHFIVPDSSKDEARYRSVTVSRMRREFELMRGKGFRGFLFRFRYRFCQNFLRDHLWLSVYFHPSPDPFTGVQRLTCLLLLVLTVLTTGALFFGQNKYVGQEILVAVIMSAIAAVSGGVFAHFFSRSGALHPAARQQLHMETRADLQISPRDVIPEETTMDFEDSASTITDTTAAADVETGAAAVGSSSSRATQGPFVKSRPDSAKSTTPEQQLLQPAGAQQSSVPSAAELPLEPSGAAAGNSLPGSVKNRASAELFSALAGDDSAVREVEMADAQRSASPRGKGELYMMSGLERQDADQNSNTADQPSSGSATVSSLKRRVSSDSKSLPLSLLQHGDSSKHAAAGGDQHPDSQQWAFHSVSTKTTKLPAQRTVQGLASTGARKTGSGTELTNSKRKNRVIPITVTNMKSNVKRQSTLASSAIPVGEKENSASGADPTLDMTPEELQFHVEEVYRRRALTNRYPQWVLVVTWIIALAWIGACMWLILVFGLKFDQEHIADDRAGLTRSAMDRSWPMSTRWLMTALLATIQDWALNKPFSVFVSTLVSLVVGKAAALGINFCAEKTCL
mgnify:CR=1 FL=1